MIEFIEETHTYIIDGVVVPSVSQILGSTIFKDKYKDVPEFVLQKAKDFGTAIHLAIETNEWIGLDEKQQEVYDRWLALKKEYHIHPVEHEVTVRYGLDYVGRFDMMAEIDGRLALVDIKTTYNLDKEYLSWQLSMYALAKGTPFIPLYAVWLPKRKGAELVEIERKTEDDIKKLLEVYHETCGEEDTTAW